MDALVATSRRSTDAGSVEANCALQTLLRSSNLNLQQNIKTHSTAGAEYMAKQVRLPPGPLEQPTILWGRTL